MVADLKYPDIGCCEPDTQEWEETNEVIASNTPAIQEYLRQFSREIDELRREMEKPFSRVDYCETATYTPEGKDYPKKVMTFVNGAYRFEGSGYTCPETPEEAIEMFKDGWELLLEWNSHELLVWRVYPELSRLSDTKDGKQRYRVRARFLIL